MPTVQYAPIWFLLTAAGNSLAQSPVAPQAPSLPVRECPPECRYPESDAAARRDKRDAAPHQPKVLAPWLASARAVNERRFSHVIWGPDLKKAIAALHEFTGLKVECSPALLEAWRGEPRGIWGEGSMEGWRRGVDLLASLRRTRHHPAWTLDQGVLRLVAEAELEELARAADSDPRNQELAGLRARVRVRWDPPVMHEGKWGNDDSRREGTLFLGGSLAFVDDGGSERNLTWPLSACVLLARRSQTAPDWTSDAPGDDTCATWTTCEDGRFAAHINLAELERVPGRTSDFAVGLCLPDLEPGGTWRRMKRLLPQSQQSIPLAGPPILGEDLQAINACVANDDQQFDPVSYVRAVNRLRRLGKPRALELLREYCRVVPSDGFAIQSPSAANLDHGNSACVFWIVRLLFEFDQAARDEVARGLPREGFDPARSLNGFAMSTGMVANRPYRVASYPGDQYPFVVADGLPFFAPDWLQGRTGYDPSPLQAIDWAEAHGTIRASDLVPTDDPIATVETLEQRVGPLPDCSKPRLQVLRALGPLVGISPEPQYFEPFGDDGNLTRRPAACWVRNDTDLTDLKQALTSHGGVHWDEAAQAYVLGPRAR